MILHRLLRERSGVAMLEFALAAPFVLTFGLWGIEMANYANANMKVSMLASYIADNVSRIGDTSTLQNRKIFEEDLNDILVGADFQAGKSIDFFKHGRAIISSVEIWDQSTHSGTSHTNGFQFISWQRCQGVLNTPSIYGNQNAALPTGIGPSGAKVNATIDSPVIFVELAYDYQPLFSDVFISQKRITATAAFLVRDNRDQSQLYKRNTITSPANC